MFIALQNKRKIFPVEVCPMLSMRGDSVLTSDEAIQYLRISKPTFLKYIRLGRIRAIKAGKGWRVLHSELYRFLKEGSSNGVSIAVDLDGDQNTDYPNKTAFD